MAPVDKFLEMFPEVLDVREKIEPGQSQSAGGRMLALPRAASTLFSAVPPDHCNVTPRTASGRRLGFRFRV